MYSSDAARLVLVHAAGPDDSCGGALSDWVASTAWAFTGFRLDEVHPSARAGTVPAWAATTPGPADPLRRIAAADAVVIVLSDERSERLEDLEALVGLVGEDWHGKPVALVYAGERITRRLDEALARLRTTLARASLDAGACFPACAPRLDACGLTRPDSPEAHALRRMFRRLLERAGRQGRTAAPARCRAVA